MAIPAGNSNLAAELCSGLDITARPWWLPGLLRRRMRRKKRRRRRRRREAKEKSPSIVKRKTAWKARD